MRTLLVALAALALNRAPFQCVGRRHPDLAREDTPGEALWRLAERFDGEGNPSARDRTLQQLVERYPNSRFAERARDALAHGFPARDAGT